MNNSRLLPYFVALFIVTFAVQAVFFSAVAIAGGKGESEDVKKVLVTVHDQLTLEDINRTAVFLTGGEPHNTRVLRDALSIELQNMGWNVVSRLELEKKVTHDWEQWLYLPDSLKADTTKVMSETQIAKLVDANAFLTGTVLFGRHQYANLEKESSASSEKIVITAISFQIVDVEQEKTILEAVVGYINGKSAPYAAEDVRQLLEENVRR